VVLRLTKAMSTNDLLDLDDLKNESRDTLWVVWYIVLQKGMTPMVGPLSSKHPAYVIAIPCTMVKLTIN